MKSIIAIAKHAGRDYVTPEDVGDAIQNGASKRRVQIELLKIIGRQMDMGAEDASLCAFVSVHERCRKRKNKP